MRLTHHVARMLVLLVAAASTGCVSGERDPATDARPSFGFRANSDEGAQAGIGFRFGDAPKKADQPR